jgi:hypothetical protein
MCYNCGCQMPDNDMGNPKNITNKTFNEASKAAGQSAEKAKKNTLELLQKTVGADAVQVRRVRLIYAEVEAQGLAARHGFVLYEFLKSKFGYH